MAVSKYRPKWVPKWIKKLLIETSRTKYCSPKDVGATVHSHRGAKLADLAATVSRYISQKLNCFTIVAGFKDKSSTVSDFANAWKFFIKLIIHRCNPNVLNIPKPSSLQTITYNIKNLGALRNSLFRLLIKFYNSRIRLVSHNLNNNFNAKMFCKDGIHFSFYCEKFSVYCSLS